MLGSKGLKTSRIVRAPKAVGTTIWTVPGRIGSVAAGIAFAPVSKKGLGAKGELARMNAPLVWVTGWTRNRDANGVAGRIVNWILVAGVIALVEGGVAPPG